MQQLIKSSQLIIETELNTIQKFCQKNKKKKITKKINPTKKSGKSKKMSANTGKVDWKTKEKI